jgi:hypothetical protein
MSAKSIYEKLNFDVIKRDKELLAFHASRFTDRNARDSIAKASYAFLMMEKEKDVKKEN